MRVGDRIRHAGLGVGTILAVQAKGARLDANVDFGYMTAWVSASELGLDARPSSADEAPESPTSRSSRSRAQVHPGLASGDVVEPQSGSSLSESVVDARRGVLALKLGQVLEPHVFELSVGTDTARADLEAVVEGAVQGRPRAVLIEGAWGSGKTHLLTMLRRIATDANMATASVILDGDGVRLSDPTRLIEAFLGSLRYPGEAAPGGIGDRLRALRRSRSGWNPLSRGAGRIADAIDAVPERAFDEPEIVTILEDYFMLSLSASQARGALARHGYRGVALPAMAARAVTERPDRFREHCEGWTEFVIRTGATALALIVDELDVEYASTKGRSAASVAAREARGRLWSALGECLGKRLPLVVAFGGVPAGDVPEEDDPVSDLARSVGESILTIRAPNPTRGQLRQLVQRVMALYERGYAGGLVKGDGPEVETLIDHVVREHLREIHPVPRRLVRHTLELLDVWPRTTPR